MNLTILKTINRPPSKYANEEERKEMVKIYNKNYYQKHKKQRKEDYKKNNSIKVMCEVCNKSLLKRNMKRHLETNTHKSNMV